MAALMFPEPVTASAAVLNENDVARIVNLSLATIRAMQLTGDGPAYARFADGRIRYSLADVLKFQALRSAAHKRLMDSFGGYRPW